MFSALDVREIICHVDFVHVLKFEAGPLLLRIRIRRVYASFALLQQKLDAFF